MIKSPATHTSSVQIVGRLVDLCLARGSLVKRHLLAFLLATSLVLNLWLVHTNTQLSSALVGEVGLKPGSSIPSFHGRTTAGLPVNVLFPNSKSKIILYYFSPTCGWCMKNHANFEALASQLQARGDWVIAYTADLGSRDQYVKVVGSNVMVLVDYDQDIRRLLKLSGTPQTLLIDNHGILLKRWDGAFNSPMQTEIEKQLQINLPGLTGISGSKKGA